MSKSEINYYKLTQEQAVCKAKQAYLEIKSKGQIFFSKLDALEYSRIRHGYDFRQSRINLLYKLRSGQAKVFRIDCIFLLYLSSFSIWNTS
jgi:hypothetical protein